MDFTLSKIDGKLVPEIADIKKPRNAIRRAILKSDMNVVYCPTDYGRWILRKDMFQDEPDAFEYLYDYIVHKAFVSDFICIDETSSHLFIRLKKHATMDFSMLAEIIDDYLFEFKRHVYAMYTEVIVFYAVNNRNKPTRVIIGSWPRGIDKPFFMFEEQLKPQAKEKTTGSRKEAMQARQTFVPVH